MFFSTMSTHTHTHTHSLTQLHSAHVWNEQGSYLLETHHWARGEVERGRHTAGVEGGEKEGGGGGGERLREREASGGVHTDDCGLGNLLQTLEVWGWAIINLLFLHYTHLLTSTSRHHTLHAQTQTLSDNSILIIIWKDGLIRWGVSRWIKMHEICNKGK